MNTEDIIRGMDIDRLAEWTNRNMLSGCGFDRIFRMDDAEAWDRIQKDMGSAWEFSKLILTSVPGITSGDFYFVYDQGEYWLTGFNRAEEMIDHFGIDRYVKAYGKAEGGK